MTSSIVWLPEFLIKSSLILLLAATINALLRGKSADLRHRVWFAAITATAAIGAFALFPRALPATITFQVATSAVPLAIRPTSNWLATLRYLWLLGAALCFLRLMAGMAVIAWWTRFAQHKVTMPLTWGFFRPRVLLPTSAADWPEFRREVAMRHESAHIQRLDWICQIVASAVTSIFWFQPLLWVALNRIRIEAERAADDQVLESGVDATAYAVELVAVARAASGRTPMTAVPMARVNQLEDRIRRILDPSTRRTPLGRAGKLIFIAVAFIASWGIGAATTAPYRVGPQSATTSPKVVHKIQPQYTQEAKAAKLAGKVRLSLEIDEEGNPTRIRVQQGLGKGLDQQAVLAVRQWKFSPGTANGRPVRVSATIEINFKLL